MAATFCRHFPQPWLARQLLRLIGELAGTIGVVLDVATKSILRMPLVGPVGPSQQVQLTGQGSWRTGTFKTCDDVAAASSICDQHPKGGVSP